MNISELLVKKTESRDKIKESYNLPKRSKIMIGVYFSDETISNFLVEGLKILPVNFIIFGKNETKEDFKNIIFIQDKNDFDMIGIDAILGDCQNIQIEKKMKLGVVPIVNQKNYLGNILQEFQPSRGEGNAYLYEDNSAWSAYYALIRYIENHNFPYDNRNLVKNVAGV